MYSHKMKSHRTDRTDDNYQINPNLVNFNEKDIRHSEHG